MEGGKDPKTYTWSKARREGPENAELSADEWRERKAKRIVDALLKAKIGQGLSKDPDIKSELAEELRRDEFDYATLEDAEDFGDASDL